MKLSDFLSEWSSQTDQKNEPLRLRRRPRWEFRLSGVKKEDKHQNKKKNRSGHCHSFKVKALTCVIEDKYDINIDFKSISVLNEDLFSAFLFNCLKKIFNN